MIWTHIASSTIGIALGLGIARLISSPQARPSSESQSDIPTNQPFESPSSFDGLEPPITEAKTTITNEALIQKFQSLEAAYHMAIEMGKFKAGFLARTSHELRSPLNSIMSLQQLILTDLCDSPEEEREFVAQSYAASKKLLALLNDTTNVSKLEEGTIELQSEPLSLFEILSELENLTHLQAINRNLKLIVTPPSPDITIMGDRRWVRQILLDLVTSAIYQMSEGTIQLSVQKDLETKTASIYLEDERPSIDWSEPADFLHQSYEPIDLKTARKGEVPRIYPSNGLSLTMTQIMMEKMHGKLILLSAPVSASSVHVSSENSASNSSDDQGTRILCSLPLSE